VVKLPSTFFSFFFLALRAAWQTRRALGPRCLTVKQNGDESLP